MPAVPSDSALADAYNAVAYVGQPARTTHPYHLAAIGTLLGLDVPAVTTSRVLELGCGDGANLVPMAAALPGATFTGCDFAERAIGIARRGAGVLALANCRFLQADLRDLPADLGSFDYIIAHGLYSWIPPEVRAHVMPLIARHLAPNGVAFVSYNTYPGCHIRQGVQEMLRFHTRGIPDLQAKLAAARELIGLLAEPAVTQSPNDEALRAELRSVALQSDSGLCHDDLADVNIPFYFHEFAEDARRTGLAFLAESEMSSMVGAGVGTRMRAALREMDRLKREQYLDFVHMRRFRESLLCHADALSQFVAQPSRIAGMHVAASSNLRKVAASGAQPAADPTTRALRDYVLARWPRNVPVAEIVAWYASRSPVADKAGSAQTRALLELAQRFVGGDLNLRADPTPVVVRAGERPTAFAPARATSGATEVVPNVYHEAVRVDDPDARKVLSMLDGTMTKDDLMQAQGEPFSGPTGRARLDGVLATLAGNAILTG